jgi:hypothetical protein
VRLSIDCMAERMPVADLGARNCRLFMWVIDTHLPQALVPT